jgi:hypothetical protein
MTAALVKIISLLGCETMLDGFRRFGSIAVHSYSGSQAIQEEKRPAYLILNMIHVFQHSVTTKKTPVFVGRLFRKIAVRNHLLQRETLKTRVIWRRSTMGFLFAFRKIAKSDFQLRHVCLSVYRSVPMEQFSSHWKVFHKICYSSIFRKSLQ